MFQVSDQLRPARPGRLVLAVPVSAPNPCQFGWLLSEHSAGEANWTAAQATAAYSLFSATCSLLMHLAHTAGAQISGREWFLSMREQFEKSKLYPAQQNPDSYLALFRMIAYQAQEIKVSRKCLIGAFLIISLALRDLEQGSNRILFKKDTINKDETTTHSPI